MLPISTDTTLPDRRKKRIKDAYLRQVLDGQASLLFDGAMGTMLQARGLAAGELPELLCLSDPEVVTEIHAQYVAAGSQVVTTNTFGANRHKLGGSASVEDVFQAAIACARASQAQYVAADIGPTGALLEPLGSLSFDEAYDLFAEQVQAAHAHGADLIIIETMTDLVEAKAAVLAAKEHSDLPIFATMTFEDTGRTLLGTTPQVAALTLQALGVDALGVNCSLGPEALTPLVKDMLAVTFCPFIVQANAGLPQVVDGETVFTLKPQDYAAAVAPMVDAGVGIVGGCCGTNPEYLALLAEELKDRTPKERTVERGFSITGTQEAVVLRNNDVAVIGERINPTGKKKLQEALRTNNTDYVVSEALAQVEARAEILDVNAGLPDINEAAMLLELVKRIQAAVGVPLQIDSSDPQAIEAAVRAYAGKPLINSVNGKQESLASILPIAAHYGCAVVGLTLDEGGIPPTAQERLAIARRIVEAAEGAGIPREDVAIDCLVMSAATNQNEVPQILEAVRLIKSELGVRTVLGVSNISFGLPARPLMNANFLAAAFSAGLDMPILNPLARSYTEVVDTWRVICGQDTNSQDYIARYANYELAAEQAHAQAQQAAGVDTQAAETQETSLKDLVIKGERARAVECTKALLQTTSALDIINEQLVPALDTVGEKFEAGTFFLPQLMTSAEAAKAAFDAIREQTPSISADKGPIALATVKGDIHDIGKNIVKMLLENYGYKVIDLGRDVEPQTIVDKALEHGCKVVGLSALMTTTVKNMEETVRLLHEQAPDIKVMVGGAVLSQAYADTMGADFYAKDATMSARFAEDLS